jgi:hypothetical protein
MIKRIGDKTKMPGIVRARSRIRFDIGIGLHLLSEGIN